MSIQECILVLRLLKVHTFILWFCSEILYEGNSSVFIIIFFFFFLPNCQGTLISVLFCTKNLLLSFSCNLLTPVMFFKPNTWYYKTIVPVCFHSRIHTENQPLLNLHSSVSKGSLHLAKLYGVKGKKKIYYFT